MKPLYNNEGTKRVISGPKNKFIAQKKVAERGTRERDNWEMIQRPTDNLELAKRQAGIGYPV